jgi:hypothetical protein
MLSIYYVFQGLNISCLYIEELVVNVSSYFTSLLEAIPSSFSYELIQFVTLGVNFCSPNNSDCLPESYRIVIRCHVEIDNSRSPPPMSFCATYA